MDGWKRKRKHIYDFMDIRAALWFLWEGVLRFRRRALAWQAFWEKQARGVLVLGRVVVLQSKLYPRFLELAGVFQFTHCSNNAFLKSHSFFALRIDAQFAAQCLLA
jgi:hypothetical protein